MDSGAVTKLAIVSTAADIDAGSQPIKSEPERMNCDNNSLSSFSDSSLNS
jgi:hypothetical protein